MNFNLNCLYYTKRGFTLCYIMLFHIFVFCCFVSSCIYYCKRNVECLNCLLIEKNFLHFYYVFLYTYIFVRFPVVGSFFAYARISIKKSILRIVYTINIYNLLYINKREKKLKLQHYIIPLYIAKMFYHSRNKGTFILYRYT